METFNKRLHEWILPKTLKSGCFGEDVILENVIIDSSSKATDQFSSEIIFVQLRIRDGVSQESKIYDTIIKVQIQNEGFRELVNTPQQFRNELLMYNDLLPMLDRNGIVQDVFCRYYYGYADPEDPNKDFIVLEDLRNYGYRLTTEKVFLDYEHCSLALAVLGKFHALSYMNKKDQPTKFFQSLLKIEEKWTKKKLEWGQKMALACAKRGIQPLIDEGESVELLTSLLNEFNDVANLFENLVNPIEPESVLCHGDFNRNNLLFKYDENLKPVGVKLIDLQTPRYSSPVIDLSFILLMNTSQRLRKEHLCDLLDVYKQSVLSTASDYCLVPELDFGKFAIYGYFHCSFFLPAMLTDGVETEDILTDDIDELTERNITRGGQKATDALVDIIKDLLDMGYLRKSYKPIFN